MIAGPVLPVGSPKAFARPKDVVAGTGGRAVLLPKASVLADRDDGRAAAIDDCGVTPPGVEGAVAGHGADLFIGRDLIQQIRQHRAVAFAARGELHRSDVAGGRVHRQMNLAVLAPAVRAVLARQPIPRRPGT